MTVTGAPTGIPVAARESILAWFDDARRDLSFRATRDPYGILVSEAMAQQTQAARASVAWTRFMEVFPTVRALADATPADVLRAWQGLGYNRRALNLWRAARRIVEFHGGEVPSDLSSLVALPGIGPYTARAVGALAFGLPVGAVDTNVRRVLGRIVAGGGGFARPADLQRVADAAVPTDRPGAWTHALMDLGSTVCRPRQPDCPRCPARAWCGYAAAGVPGEPAKVRGIRRSSPPFPATSRWLRGRIIDRLRTVRGDDWIVIDGPIGTHSLDAVVTALDALAREGLVELASLDGAGAVGRRARLSVG
jgi:A/G-specific adenine glycosylase